MSRVQFDKEIDTHLNEIMLRLKAMGIKHVTRPMALRFIIEMNKTVQVKVKRRPKDKFGFIFQ